MPSLDLDSLAIACLVLYLLGIIQLCSILSPMKLEVPTVLSLSSIESWSQDNQNHVIYYTLCHVRIFN